MAWVEGARWHGRVVRNEHTEVLQQGYIVRAQQEKNSSAENSAR